MHEWTVRPYCRTIDFIKPVDVRKADASYTTACSLSFCRSQSSGRLLIDKGGHGCLDELGHGFASNIQIGRVAHEFICS